jgi:hypothetical protein
LSINEAYEVIKYLKSGKQYKQGHYQVGYEYLYYDSAKKSFVYKREELGLDFFNPEITEEFLSEKEMINELIKKFSYKDIINNLC